MLYKKLYGGFFMKKIILLLGLIFSLIAFGKDYPNKNINLIGF